MLQVAQARPHANDAFRPHANHAYHCLLLLSYYFLEHLLTTEAGARLDERLLLGDPSREFGADGAGLAPDPAPGAAADVADVASDVDAASATFAASRSARRCVIATGENK